LRKLRLSRLSEVYTAAAISARAVQFADERVKPLLNAIGEVLLLRFTSVCALLDLFKAHLDVGSNFL
jgi:hypothetical protein